MSKLTDAIMERATGRRYTQKVHPMLVVNNEYDRPINEPFSLMVEHTVHISFGQTMSYLPEDSKMVMRNVERQFKEMIYGEIKASVNRMEMALMEQDLDKMRMEMRELMREVFE